MDKILRVNMGAEGGPTFKKSRWETMPDWAAGRLTSAVVAKEVPPLCHPLSEDNKLVIAPGLLSGTAAAMSGRISVGCKSPLTGGIKEANSGGQACPGAGTTGLCGHRPGREAEGRRPLSRSLSTKTGSRSTVANSLKMLPNYDLVEQDEKGIWRQDRLHLHRSGRGDEDWRPPPLPITDMELRPTRHAGRGGVGRSWAPKGVKVIVLDDTG